MTVISAPCALTTAAAAGHRRAVDDQKPVAEPASQMSDRPATDLLYSPPRLTVSDSGPVLGKIFARRSRPHSDLIRTLEAIA